MNIAGVFQVLWKYRRAIVAVVMIIIIMLLFNECNKNATLKKEAEAEQQRNTQNLAALTENLSEYVNNNGDASYQKPVAEMSIEEVKQHFPLLYDAIKAESGEIKYIVQQQIVYRDTGSVQNQIADLANDEYALKFNYLSNDSVLTVIGESQFTAFPYMTPEEKMGLRLFPGNTVFSDTKIQFGLTTGVRKDKDGIDRIFITPSSSKISITDIQGADLTGFLKERDKDIGKKKRIAIGPYIGYGLEFGKGGGMSHGLNVGVGVSYGLIRF